MKLAISLFLLMAVLVSCSLTDKPESIPAYISIDSMILATEYINEGSSSHKITDAWVYVDENLQGIYPLPAKFPVIATGNHVVDIKGGIKVNGISATRAAYPFYTFYTTSSTFIDGQTISLTPSVKYFSSLNFLWKEDFESPGSSISKSNTTDTLISTTTNVAEVFEGIKSGKVYLNSSQTIFECMSASAFPNPTNKSYPLYLEMNYKSNNSFVVGVIGNLLSGGIEQRASLYLKSSKEWNKIYISISEQLYSISNLKDFHIFIGMKKDSGNETCELLIDNIKLITNK